MASITDINLIDLMPSSLKDDPDILACVESINDELKEVSALCDVPAIRSRTDELSSKTLDHMAWQVDSKVWRDSWPVDLKRSVIDTVVLYKAKKGTLAAVKNALASLGSQTIVKEWFEHSPKKIPHTFDIAITVNGGTNQPDEEVISDLRLMLDDVKPVRSKYTLALATQARASINTVTAAQPINYIRVDAVEVVFTLESKVNIVAANRPINYTRLNSVAI